MNDQRHSLNAFLSVSTHERQKSPSESLAKIKELVQSGVRSPGWNLKDNVTRAVEDGNPDPEFLDKLSRVISEEIELQELEGYDIWRKKRQR